MRRSVRLTTVLSSGVSPLAITGLWGWWDMSDLTRMYTTSAGSTKVANDGDLVGRVEDKSGNARHLLQSSDAARPTYKASVFGNRGATLHGVSVATYFDSTGFTPDNEDLTCLAVIKAPATVAAATSYGSMTTFHVTGSNGTRFFFIDTDSVFKTRTSATAISSGVTVTDGMKLFGAATVLSTGSPTRKFFYQGTDTPVTNNNAVTATDQIVRVGTLSVNNTNTPWTGWIAEVLMFSPSISDQNVLALRGYLNSKWSVF